MNFIIRVLVVLMVFSASEAFSSDYYVNFDAMTNGDGSLGSPWNNWTNAKKSDGTVTNGDTVYLWGTTNNSVTFLSMDAGSFGSPIAYEARDGYTLTLDRNGGDSAIKFDDNADYLIFRGQTPTDPSDTADYNFIITDVGEGIEFTLASTNSSDYVELRNILFNSITGYSSITTESGLVTHLTVDGCYLDSIGTDNAEHGMYFSHCDSCIISNNYIKNSSGNGLNFQARYGYTSANTEIYNNRIWGSGQIGNGYGIRLAEYSNISNQLTNFKIYNNLVWGNARAGLYTWGQSTGNKFYNNTSYNNSHGIAIDGTVTSSLEFRNNAIYNNTNASLYGSSTQSNNVTTDPPYLSVDSTHADFLKLDSSASSYIDQGYDTSAVVTGDILGVFRPINNFYDIGAHELDLLSLPRPQITTITIK